MNKVVVQYGAGSTYPCSVQIGTIEGFAPALTTTASDNGDPNNLWYNVPTGGQSTFTVDAQKSAASELFFTIGLGGNCSYFNVIFSATKAGALTHIMNSPDTKGLPVVNLVTHSDHFAIEVGAYTSSKDPSSWIKP
ncbi:MAG: hypothetical protein HEP71_21780 [Roseivirga sp.]|nr:hypothetical protein [Roseivirga sp.]